MSDFNVNLFAQRTVDVFSTCATPIRMAYGSETTSLGSGFFWNDGTSSYIVTNWHVLTGRHPITHQPLTEDGCIPNRILYNKFWRGSLNSFYSVVQPIYQEDGRALFFEHPRFRSEVDICVLPVDVSAHMEDHPAPAVEAVTNCLNSVPLDDDIPTEIGSDVFILGFPLGLLKTGPYPIWKRGSIASEYIFDVDRRPCFLIDTATREGMSGSPVLLRRQPNPRVIGLTSWEQPRTRFLGVYSGRHIGAEMEAQLGIVWRSYLIDEIISARQPVVHNFSY